MLQKAASHGAQLCLAQICQYFLYPENAAAPDFHALFRNAFAATQLSTFFRPWKLPTCKNCTENCRVPVHFRTP